MIETDYRQDFIVTWVSPNTGGENVREGFTEEKLEVYIGDTWVERIQQMYYEFNHSLEMASQRVIIKIEQVTRSTIFGK